MPSRKKQDDLLEPADDAHGVDLPPHFTEAHKQVCALIDECDTAGIPTDTMLAALLTELMPRLVQAYGPSGVATMLNQLASEISSTGEPPVSIQ